jgi:hypothetical protein
MEPNSSMGPKQGFCSTAFVPSLYHKFIIDQSAGGGKFSSFILPGVLKQFYRSIDFHVLQSLTVFGLLFISLLFLPNGQDMILFHLGSLS